jgi:hypothetical protein
LTELIEITSFSGDNEGVVNNRNPMPQERWPLVVQSISGIPAEDWKLFKNRCQTEGITQGKAMELAVADLANGMRRGEKIEWRPSKGARAKPVRMHDDTITDVRKLVDESGFLQNVIFGTAMYRWATRD